MIWLKHKKIIIFSILLLLTVIIILASFGKNINSPMNIRLNCSDGTLLRSCSNEKPYYCENSILVKKATLCGCNGGYTINGEDCNQIKKICEDGTPYNSCSLKKPLFCKDGVLVENNLLCACEEGFIFQDNKCISKYLTEPKNIQLRLKLRGMPYLFDFIVYRGLKNYLKDLPRGHDYNSTFPITKEKELEFINEKHERSELLKIVEKIKEITSNKDDQAKLAISFVELMPFDDNNGGIRVENNINGVTRPIWEETNYTTNRYPYEIVLDNTGIAYERARLMAFLLRELGFRVALIKFDGDFVEIGLGCPIERSNYIFEEKGYCFVEVTDVGSIGGNWGEYQNCWNKECAIQGKLTNEPEIIPISEGIEFGFT